MTHAYSRVQNWKFPSRQPSRTRQSQWLGQSGTRQSSSPAVSGSAGTLLSACSLIIFFLGLLSSSMFLFALSFLPSTIYPVLHQVALHCCILPASLAPI